MQCEEFHKAVGEFLSQKQPSEIVLSQEWMSGRTPAELSYYLGAVQVKCELSTHAEVDLRAEQLGTGVEPGNLGTSLLVVGGLQGTFLWLLHYLTEL